MSELDVEAAVLNVATHMRDVLDRLAFRRTMMLMESDEKPFTKETLKEFLSRPAPTDVFKALTDEKLTPEEVSSIWDAAGKAVFSVITEPGIIHQLFPTTRYFQEPTDGKAT
jgi:hypothetical protein